MTGTSWLKKLLNGRSKGVSTVIGTIFLMLIIFMVSTNVLLWTFSQNAQYTQEVKAVNQEEADRRNEKVVATDVDYSVSGNEVTVKATLTNTGSVAVQIVNLWVFDNTNQTYGFNNTIESLNLNLNPGNIRTVSVVVTVPEADQNHKFNSFFVTARGNVVPLEEKEVTEEIITSANVTQGIGSIAMDFPSFRYYVVNKDGTLGDPQFRFTIPGNETTVLGLNLTNFDKDHRTINLTGYSCIWLLVPPVGEGTPHGATWSITKVVNDKVAGFNYQILEYRNETLVYFGPTKPTRSVQGEVAAVNILLFGKIGDDDYGQNIPFVAVYVQGKKE